MKRSLQVTTPLLTATALSLLTACHPHPAMQRCVDRQNTLVPIENCLNRTAEQGAAKYPEYVFYYGGKTEAEVGSTVGDGTFTPLPGHTYRATSNRNGFGSAETIFIPVVVGGIVLLGIFGSGG